MIKAACIVAAFIAISMFFTWCMCRAARRADDRGAILRRLKREQIIAAQITQLEASMREVREMLDALR